jgi:anti-sigma B factor antagonist
MSFSFHIKREEPLLVISFTRSLMNKKQVQPMLDKIAHFLGEGLKKISVNLAEIDYMNTKGLTSLIHIFTPARNNGGEVVITNIPEKINQLVVITKLNSIFNIEETVEDAKKILI